MKLSDWASIAEVISGIAVVVTLVFLIIGIRDNTDVVRAAAFAGYIDTANDFTLSMATDPDLRPVYMAFVTSDTENLSVDDRQALQLLVNVIFRNYEKAYFSEQYGLIGPTEWQRTIGNICRGIGMARDAEVADVLDLLLSEEFMGFIRNTC